MDNRSPNNSLGPPAFSPARGTIVEMSETHTPHFLEALSSSLYATTETRFEYGPTRVSSSRLMASPLGYAGIGRRHSGILVCRFFFFLLPLLLLFFPVVTVDRLLTTTSVQERCADRQALRIAAYLTLFSSRMRRHLSSVDWRRT
jgi:hypothetical protein